MTVVRSSEKKQNENLESPANFLTSKLQEENKIQYTAILFAYFSTVALTIMAIVVVCSLLRSK